MGKSTADIVLAVAEENRAAGRLNKAKTSLRKNLRSNPQDAKSLHILGLIARDRGRHDRAIQLLDKAVTAAPMAPEIRCDLGHALKAVGRHDESIVAQARVIEQLPKSALAWSNHGSALTAASRYDEAIAFFTKALLLEPNGAESHFNHGNAMHAIGDPSGAEAAFVRTLDLSPYHVGALENLSCVLKEQGRLGEAEDLLRSACALYPELSDLRWNHALALLMSENYHEGWVAYEARRAIPDFAIRDQTLPPWDGSDLAGRTLLVHAEQGFGDTIQFSRYIHLFAGQDENIVFQVPTRLLPLLHTLNGSAEITDSPKAAARCDIHVPLLSLPHLLGPRAPFWPESGASLTPEADRVADWKTRLAGHLADHGGLSVAIAWQGDPEYQADKTRSIPLAAFAPLAELPACSPDQPATGPRLRPDRNVRGAEQHCATGRDYRSGRCISRFRRHSGQCRSDDLLRYRIGSSGRDTQRTDQARFIESSRLALGHPRRHKCLVPEHALVSTTLPGRLGFRLPFHRDVIKGKAGMSASLTTLSSFKIVDSVEVEVSPGELIDKITILEIKLENISTPEKKNHVRYELDILRLCRKKSVPDSLPLQQLMVDLKAVNRRLWTNEDEIREHERKQVFDARFITLTRSVYQNNDKRADLKAQINGLFGAAMVEEKSHADYGNRD